MNRNNPGRLRQLFKLSLNRIANFGNSKITQTRVIIFFALMLAIVVITSNPPAGESIKLNEDDSGKTVEILVGDEVEVILPGNPTTGYVWDLILLDMNILRPDKTEVFSINKALGSGDVEVIKFHAIAAGESPVKLIFHRPFEHKVPPLITFEVNVVVKKTISE
ncbi:MAG: protease inhibitor I42 family protein [Methylococcales bacterium]|nr:protease inhibitor I42 family protein [Methylococcales bacterium]